MRRQSFEAAPSTPALQGGPRPHAALLLIDCQRAFLDGYWAQHFGTDQVEPIERAFANTIALLRRPALLSGCAVLRTKCYTDGDEAEHPPELDELLRDVPCVWKPTTDVTLNPRFHDWLRQRLAAGVQTLVVGGCTTTSCVRDSSQAIRRHYRDAVRIVVDRSLCGARVDNYLPNADRDPNLVRIYGRERCSGASPVELAELQMRTAGVEVVDAFDWAAAMPEGHRSPGAGDDVMTTPGSAGEAGCGAAAAAAPAAAALSAAVAGDAERAL